MAGALRSRQRFLVTCELADYSEHSDPAEAFAAANSLAPQRRRCAFIRRLTDRHILAVAYPDGTCSKSLATLEESL